MKLGEPIVNTIGYSPTVGLVQTSLPEFVSDDNGKQKTADNEALSAVFNYVNRIYLLILSMELATTSASQ